MQTITKRNKKYEKILNNTINIEKESEQKFCKETNQKMARIEKGK